MKTAENRMESFPSTRTTHKRLLIKHLNQTKTKIKSVVAVSIMLTILYLQIDLSRVKALARRINIHVHSSFVFSNCEMRRFIFQVQTWNTNRISLSKHCHSILFGTRWKIKIIIMAQIASHSVVFKWQTWYSGWNNFA